MVVKKKKKIIQEKIKIILKAVDKKANIALKAIFAKVKEAYLKDIYKTRKGFNKRIVARKAPTTTTDIGDFFSFLVPLALL